jgi:hypothetical protein
MIEQQNNNIVNVIEQINNGFFQFIKRIASGINEIQGNLEPFFNNLNKTIFQAITGIHNFLETTMPKATRITLILLAQNGWYISLDMPISQLIEFTDELLSLDDNKERREKIDKVMSSYYTGHIETIRDDIIKYFPHRKKIIDSAINAHKRCEYELSVPVILSQADGICQELIGIQLYKRINKGKQVTPKTAEFVKQFASDTYMTALLQPFCELLPISSSENERKQLGNILNRHAILHGESYEYDIEINSLKAISLINYVTKALLMAKNREVDEKTV